jgi:hypothetical protein
MRLKPEIKQKEIYLVRLRKDLPSIEMYLESTWEGMSKYVDTTNGLVLIVDNSTGEVVKCSPDLIPYDPAG